MSIKALERHLAPLAPFLKAKGVTEVCINQPGEVYVECDSHFTRYEVAELEVGLLETLVGLVAEFNHKEFPTPLLAGSLPTGERVQFIRSPACEKSYVIGSIRRPTLKDFSLEDYDAMGAFQTEDNKTMDASLLTQFYEQHDYLNFIKCAILQKKNILISGGTGTGKTTFLNACLKMVPATERIITVEDTREVKVSQLNKVHLLFNEEDKSITALNIFKVCLRLRPDRIFLSELRGAEVWPYLRAANSGHPGSISTVHADSPEAAFTQLVFMMQQAGSTSTEEQLRAYVKSIIPIVVQLKRDAAVGRFMRVSEIYFNGF